MKKGELTSGEKMFVVRTEHYVKISDFAKHLTERYYKYGEDFNKKISKKEAEKILKNGLFFYGLYGEIETTQFEGSFEESEKWNQIYVNAYEWVKIKYEYLTTQKQWNTLEQT